jgi:hypothetical protein
MKRKLQIFVSSTFKDLIPERQAAVAAILKAGHIPAGMELFTAGDQSQMATIKEWIDESDVYMLILGGRYGSIEKTTGLSYTELEYDYAAEQGKALFAVVIKEDALEGKVREGGSLYIEKENPKELARFRTKVLSNMSSFFEDHKDVRLAVYETLSDFAANRDLKGWISATEVIDTKPLVDELAKLAEENRALREALEKSKTVKTPAKKAEAKERDLATNELANLLAAIDIKIPAGLAGGKETTVDLLNIFFNNKDTLISGVTNAHGISDAETFYYFNICPKLQVYGLTANEAVPGVRWRRSYVTPYGAKFLAEIERQQIIKKTKSGGPKPSSAGPAAPAPVAGKEPGVSEGAGKLNAEVGPVPLDGT